MKFILWFISIVVALFGGLAVALFLKTDLRPLEPHEIIFIKENKDFWEWHSPYGKLAVHYDEKGTGNQHILLLHGYRSHTFTWRHLVEPLAEQGYHVWSLDLIGYGFSDKPDHVPYTPDFFIEQIVAFMQAHDIQVAHLVGNSLGGGLALHLALNHPEAVSSLTLINPLGYPLEMPVFIAIARYFEYIWVPFLGPTQVREGLKNAIYKCERISEEQVQAYCLPYRLPGGITSSLITLRQFDNQWLCDMIDRYPTLRQPILLIWGMQDNILPIDHYHQFTQQLPKAGKELITNCGHLPQEEEPEQVLTALSSFLASIPSPNHSDASDDNQQNRNSDEQLVESDLKVIE